MILFYKQEGVALLGRSYLLHVSHMLVSVSILSSVAKRYCFLEHYPHKLMLSIIFIT